MNKPILLAAALLVASQASAYAQGDHASRHHRHMMSSQAQMRGHGGRFYYRVPEYYAPPMYAPSYNNDDDAEGRTSG